MDRCLGEQRSPPTGAPFFLGSSVVEDLEGFVNLEGFVDLEGFMDLEGFVAFSDLVGA